MRNRNEVLADMSAAHDELERLGRFDSLTRSQSDRQAELEDQAGGLISELEVIERALRIDRITSAGPANLEMAGGPQPVAARSDARQVGAAGPVVFGDDDIESAYMAVRSHQPARILSRAVTAYPQITNYGQPDMVRREPTRMLDLLPVQRITQGDSATYWTASAGATAAAAVAVGALKPESTPGWAPATAPVRKVAHWTEAPNEAFDDFASFREIVNIEMVAGVIAAENQQILSGTGVAPQLTGLLATTGILTYAPVAAEARALSLLEAVTNLRTGAAFADADRIVLHPTDYKLIRRWQSTTNELVIGDATAAGPPTLWGVPVSVTTGLAAGTALVGDLRGSVVAFQREAPGIFVDPYSQSTRNVTRIIAETRLALGVIRPAGLIKITFNGAL